MSWIVSFSTHGNDIFFQPLYHYQTLDVRTYNQEEKCFTAECKDFFGRSLFFVGEFGINDYHYSFGKKSMQEIRAFVPDLIQTISMGAEARLYLTHHAPHVTPAVFSLRTCMLTS